MRGCGGGGTWEPMCWNGCAACWSSTGARSNSKSLRRGSSRTNSRPRASRLAAPRHCETYGIDWDASLHCTQLIFRAFGRTSTFDFINDARRDLALELTGRLPSLEEATRVGTVTVSLNGRRVSTFRLAGPWRRRRWVVDRSFLRRGFNRVCLQWPLPDAMGDAALACAVKRWRLGVPADVYPVFGEVFSFRVRPCLP